ncbi:GNAT family N-acetyltransferase [Streptomyces albidoflavus]
MVAVGADGQVVGWACCGPRDTPGDGPGAGEGEVYALYVRPDLLGRGVGRALLDAVHDEAAARGWGALVLWVGSRPTRAPGASTRRPGTERTGARRARSTRGWRCGRCGTGGWRARSRPGPATLRTPSRAASTPVPACSAPPRSGT